MLAVGLALVVMVGWNYLFTPPPPNQPDGALKTPTGATVAPSILAPARSQVGLGLDGQPVAAPSPEADQPEQRMALTFPHLAVEFSSRGGSLVSWKLTDPKYRRDSQDGELVAPGKSLLGVNFARSTYVIPPGALWQGEKVSDTQVRYRYRSEAIEVVKTFTLHPDDYLIQLVVHVSSLKGELNQRVAVTSYGYQDPRVKVESNDHTRAFMSSTLPVTGDLAHTPHESLVEAPRYSASFRWTGFDHPYLLVAMAPHPRIQNVEKFTAVTPDPGGIQTDVLFPTTTLRAGEAPATFELITYAGPKYYEELERADKTSGFSTGFKDTVDLGWFKIIGRPLLSILGFLHGLVGNWGVAIILLTFLVKLATLYWTTKSMRSMKAMAALAPRMQELKAKYGDDQSRMQAETMALYKQNGVNPLAGCLPIFLQMPIWIALYRMLSSATELYLQPFIPGWIGDLTSRDPYYVLPILVTGTMFLQTKLQPVTGDGMQQKIMLYGMPLMFGVMGLFFPSGLTLYMFTNTVLSALHSLYMNKYDKPSLAMAARMKEAADAAKAAKDGAAPAKASPTTQTGAAKASPSSSADASSAASKESVASRGPNNSNGKNKRKR
jgi:YidC/Oxa1 family membrane protein insertase